MGETLSELYARLTGAVSAIEEVRAIGKCGGEQLPENGESDIDLYIFCRSVPAIQTRKSAVQTLGDAVGTAAYSEQRGRFWGTIDFITAAETEICLMYFTITEMDQEIESVLNGSRLDKEAGEFYPTGRCAGILSLHAPYDPDGYIAGLKDHLSVYPPVLSEKMFRHHIGKANDTESFERAVSRADVLFYHETVENAIDHFLQALFALNKCFFPSRKRTKQFIDAFDIKPTRCMERLLQIIKLGAQPETLNHSYAAWTELYEALCALDGANKICKDK